MLDKKLAKEFKIGIADIIISLKFESKKHEHRFNNTYKRFIVKGKPQVTLQVHYGYIPDYYFKKIIFEGDIWSLYQGNRKYFLKFSSKLGILEPDFKCGNIYIKPQNLYMTNFPLDYPLGELLMVNLLAKDQGMLIHASGISDDGHGLLFVGAARVGKSTVANLWKNKKNTEVLNDDRIIIRKMNGKFWMYGTPWHGNAKVCSPEKAALERIFFLNHAQENKAKEIERIDSAAKLLVCSFPPFWDKKGMEFTLGFIDELTREIQCYDLGFLPDESVIDFVKNI